MVSVIIAVAGDVTRDNGLEDVRVADLARPSQGSLRLESIHRGLHGGVRGTRLGKPLLDLANRRLAAGPQDFQDLQFEPGQDAATLGLNGTESFDIDGIAAGIIPKKKLTVRAGNKIFTAIARVDTPQEVEYIVHGDILQYVLRQRAAALK